MNLVVDDLDNLKCPICLEIYEKPRQIACGHVFCEICLQTLKHDDDNLKPCPVCRQPSDITLSKKAYAIINTINTSSGVCSGCSTKVPLLKLRYHNSTCTALSLSDKLNACSLTKDDGSQASGTSAQKVNRYTFQCPYCDMKNLDTTALLQHCNKDHASSQEAVVCPICASMPWGDPTQTSSNFISHVNMRHKFEYNNVVDFNLDDDEALDLALKASLKEQ